MIPDEESPDRVGGGGELQVEPILVAVAEEGAELAAVNVVVQLQQEALVELEPGDQTWRNLLFRSGVVIQKLSDVFLHNFQPGRLKTDGKRYLLPFFCHFAIFRELTHRDAVA